MAPTILVAAGGILSAVIAGVLLAPVGRTARWGILPSQCKGPSMRLPAWFGRQ